MRQDIIWHPGTNF